MTTIAYLIKGTDIDAEYDGLRGKTVAVVCRPPLTMDPHQAHAARELAERVSYLLQQNVRKIKVIEQQDVANWTDENSWDDFREIGRALEAEMVLAIEMEDFSLHRSASVFQGRATTKLTVYDMQKDGKVAWEKLPPQSVYPPNSGLPISRRASEFRERFVGVLAEEIGRHFYKHDAVSDYAEDTSSLDFH